MLYFRIEEGLLYSQLEETYLIHSGMYLLVLGAKMNVFHTYMFVCNSYIYRLQYAIKFQTVCVPRYVMNYQI